MPTMSNRHQNKKPFQPPPNHITNYFSSADSHASHQRSAQPKETAPSLTPAIQASLLSVGMRIRKAVPEGYKTHKTHPSTPAAGPDFADFADADFLVAAIAADGESTAPTHPAAAVVPHQSELTPYCGLHRVGGLATPQDHSWWAACRTGAVDAYAGDEGGAAWGSSQESAVSVEDGPRRGAGRGDGFLRRKRRLDDGEDEDGDGGEDGEEGEGAETRWLPLQRQEMVSAAGRRMAARPVRGRAAIGSRRLRDGGAVQSVQLLQASHRGGTDFGEADFLQPWDDGEVEMGGT